MQREKFRRYVSLDEVEQYVAGIASHAETLPDPPAGDPIARDPNDDYLIALARAAQADAIVSGGEDLLVLERIEPPILSPAASSRHSSTSRRRTKPKAPHDGRAMGLVGREDADPGDYSVTISR